MAQAIQLMQLTVDELTEIINNSVKKQLEALSVNIGSQVSQEQKEFITRKELKEMLNVSYVTIHNHCKRGTLKKYTFGNRTLFKLSEVQALINRSSTDS
jgi:hypothetical protein